MQQVENRLIVDENGEQEIYIFSPIFEESYELFKRKFEEQFKKEMPEKESIPFDDDTLFRVQLNKVYQVVFTADWVYVLRTDKGFITDFSSMPRVLRGKRPWYLAFTYLPDNDHPKVVINSIFHDAGGAFHLFEKPGQITKAGFHTNNALFYELNRYMGFSKRTCKVMDWGVSTKTVGWKLYQNGRGYEKGFCRADLQVFRREEFEASDFGKKVLKGADLESK